MLYKSNLYGFVWKKLCMFRRWIFERCPELYSGSTGMGVTGAVDLLSCKTVLLKGARMIVLWKVSSSCAPLSCTVFHFWQEWLGDIGMQYDYEHLETQLLSTDRDVVWGNGEDIKLDKHEISKLRANSKKMEKAAYGMGYAFFHSLVFLLEANQVFSAVAILLLLIGGRGN